MLLCVILVSVILMSVILMSVILMSVILMNVVLMSVLLMYKDCHRGKCHSAVSFRPDIFLLNVMAPLKWVIKGWGTENILGIPGDAKTFRQLYHFTECWKIDLTNFNLAQYHKTICRVTLKITLYCVTLEIPA